jgi:hypothetical protein
LGKTKSINGLTAVSTGSGRVKMHPEEDEKRTEVRVYNAPRQREKDGDNGEFATLASEAWLLLQSGM